MSMKYHPHGAVLFITFSIEQGLLLLSNPLCRAIIQSCLARAQHKYPLRICHFEVETTHIHLVAVVDNPEDVHAFIRHFKTETSHAINALLGREKRTVWCEGYDSPVVLTPLRALIAIAYLYANPAKDNLEISINHYPGMSSWYMYRKGEHAKTWQWLRRPQYQTLAPDSHNLRGYTKEAKRLLAEASSSHTFMVEPDAWLEAFDIVDPAEKTRWNQRIVERIATLERRAEKKRVASKKTVIGRAKLLNQRLDTTYLPKRSGRRMWCLTEDWRIRARFIKFFKELQEEARAVRRRWFVGDFSEPYPPGLYPPSLPKLAEPVAVAVW